VARRPFDRERDLKVNQFDLAVKATMLKKARKMNERFVSGQPNNLVSTIFKQLQIVLTFAKLPTFANTVYFCHSFPTPSYNLQVNLAEVP